MFEETEIFFLRLIEPRGTILSYQAQLKLLKFTYPITLITVNAIKSS